MARTKTSKAWMHEHLNDTYVKRAQAEGFRSRAAYKLTQMASRDKLLRPGMLVVDLGAAPGGWSQVAAQAVKPGGQVIAVDVLEMPELPGVRFVRGDFHDVATLSEVELRLGGNLADLVLSDMAPNMSGVADVDQARVMALAELALEFAINHLKPQGNLVVKLFQGAGFEQFVKELRIRFGQVLTRKPEASRSRSNEVYLLGKGLKRV